MRVCQEPPVIDWQHISTKRDIRRFLSTCQKLWLLSIIRNRKFLRLRIPPVHSSKMSGILTFKIFVFCVLAVILAEAAAAASGHTTLLATTEPLQGGVTADLYLETKPGTGRVFIESSPLTKIDTQISTRFAKDVACDYTGKDCSRIDFFYTIKANAAIIGGPSAGAAVAALTAGVLDGTELNQSVAITGTINSGSIIGHVGGIPEKAEAAHDSGITKVLIPKGEVIGKARNRSINTIEYGKSLGIDVVEVFSLDEAMEEFTGKKASKDNNRLSVSQEYSRVMESLASRLCKRTNELEKTEYSADSEVSEIARNLSRLGFEEKNAGSYYAAASFCFGANVRYKYLELASQNLTRKDIIKQAEEVKRQTEAFEKGLKNATTVSDAQTIAIMRDRTSEAIRHANTSIAAAKANSTELSAFELAFAIERLKSAEAWSSFIGVMKEVEISEKMLKDACLKKVAEAQERVEYSSILIGSSSDGAAAILNEAQRLLEEKDYVQCLHKATLSKAEANALLGVIGMGDEEITGVVERKIKTAEMIIARQSEKGIFPIIGYSYYEYSKSLKSTDKYSALLFSEYALEFSNLDIYFRKANSAEPSYAPEAANSAKIGYMLAAIEAGIIAGILMLKGKKKGRILIRKARKRA